MRKRTTPKIFGHAKAFHRSMTPAETKLWTHLRAHRMGNVHFRNQHAIGNLEAGSSIACQVTIPSLAALAKWVVEVNPFPSTERKIGRTIANGRGDLR